MKKKMFLALGLCLSTALAGLTAQAEDDTEKGGKAYWQVENAADYVTLGEYTGLDVEKTIYQLTDEDVDIELDNVLYEQAELVDAGRGAEIGDVVNMDLTIKVDGEEETVPDYTIDLGYGELGSDFDTEVNGHSAGETLSFDITYDGEEEDIIEEWIGKTVSFTVKLNSVQVNDVPQFSDEWVKANSDFDDMDSYREDLREKLTEKSDKQSTYEAASAAIQTAVENSTFDGYPQDLYDIVYDQQVAQYEMMAEMFGILGRSPWELAGELQCHLARG